MKAVVINKPQSLGKLKITEVEKPTFGKSDLLIKIMSIGVNYADLLAVQGLYNWNPKPPYILGIECAGVVEKIGASVTKYKEGDRVVVPTKGGAYAEYISKNEDEVLSIPDSTSFYEATTLCANWATAWTCIFELARARKGEKILIHSAAGGVGTSSIILSKSLGLEVYGTTSRNKKDYIEKLGAIPLEYNNFSKYFNNKVIKPDIIIESVGGDIHKESLKILAPMGRFISLGATSIKVNKFSLLSWYKAWKSFPKVTRTDLNSQGYFTLHMGHLLENNRQYVEPIWNRMLLYMEHNKLKPVVNYDQIFSFFDINKAHNLMENRRNIGKIIIDPTI